MTQAVLRDDATMAAIAAEDDAATRVLMALHRLAQQSTLYADNNEAQHQAVKAVAEASQAYGAAVGRNITVYFSERAVYVGRRLLRGSRSTYAAAAHLRTLLARMGASQITIGHDVPLDDVRRLQVAFTKVMTEGAEVQVPADLNRIRLRAGRPPGDIAELETLSPEARAIKVYALAIVIVRRFYEQLQKGQWEITSHVRRISEELISLGGNVSPAVLATTACRPAHDDAERTVSAALLALCMAQQLTSDQRLLRWLATGALLCEVGKPRVAGQDPDGSPRLGLRSPILAEHQYAELPGATAFVTTALGRLTDAGMMRSVVVYEALHIEHPEETGAIYDGVRGPAMLSRLLACARRFQERLSKGNAAADVIADLVQNAANEVDRWIVQLLMATLNVLPTGTIVELDDGRWARVVSPPLDRIDFGRPLVRLVGRPGQTIESRYVDLNVPDGNRAPPRIARIVAAVDEEQPAVQEEAPAPATGIRARLSGGDMSAIAATVPVSDAAPDTPRSLQGAHVARAPLHPRGEPKAKGTLDKSPLVHLLVYAADNDLEGTLLLEVAGERSAIVFRRGRPSKTQAAGHQSLRMSDLEAEDCDKRLRQQMVDEVGAMMQLPPHTKFSFFETDLLAVQPEACAIDGDPLPLIMMGVRKYLDYDTFDQVLPRVANAPLVLHERASPTRLGLKPSERKVVMLLRDRELTLNAMLADEDIDEDVAQRTVYALVITRQLVMGDEKRLPVAHSR